MLRQNKKSHGKIKKPRQNKKATAKKKKPRKNKSHDKIKMLPQNKNAMCYHSLEFYP